MLPREQREKLWISYWKEHKWEESGTIYLRSRNKSIRNLPRILGLKKKSYISKQKQNKKSLYKKY